MIIKITKGKAHSISTFASYAIDQLTKQMQEVPTDELNQSIREYYKTKIAEAKEIKQQFELSKIDTEVFSLEIDG